MALNLKPSLLEAYYLATLPYRMAVSAVQGWRRRAPVAVLFYHRVADTHPNPWTISRRDFTRQLDWLGRHFDFVSLAEAQKRIEGGSRRPAVSITFDDGYAENCQYALPLLIAREIPCTYFVTLENVLEQAPFPHDLQRGEPLPPNTLHQLRELSRQGVDIGAHTRTHRDLGSVTDENVLYDEIVLSGAELSRLVGCPVRYFAYPFGQEKNLNTRGTTMARENGYKAVCSAFGGKNRPGDDPFCIRRIHGDPMLARVKNWLTADPRELWRERRPATHATKLDRPAVPAGSNQQAVPV